jgi:hypothetical protein
MPAVCGSSKTPELTDRHPSPRYNASKNGGPVARIRQDDAGKDLGVPTQQSELDLSQADDITISDVGPVIEPATPPLVG